jgi:hypothetical protein
LVLSRGWARGQEKTTWFAFPAKLTFQDGKYRTDGLNPVLAIILQKTNGLQNEKTRNIVISENVSGDVPRKGLEPSYFAAPDPKSGVSTNFTTWAEANNLTEKSCFIQLFLFLT